MLLRFQDTSIQEILTEESLLGWEQVPLTQGGRGRVTVSVCVGVGVSNSKGSLGVADWLEPWRV